ncbi:MAG: thiaminase II [Nitrososphaerota archaeon]
MSKRIIDKFWADISDIYEAIINHEFIRHMLDGTLPIDIFKHYVFQDYLYLGEFARAVAIVGAKAPDDDWAAVLFNDAGAAMTIERRWLHEYLLSEWGIKPEELSRISMTPVNLAYTSYLLATSTMKPFEEGLAALLPCFWVYREVGLEMLRNGSPVPAYQRWIDTYSSEDYGRAVNEVLSIAEQAFEKLDAVEILRARKAFRTSTLYEYLFWDRAYVKENWPLRLLP